jgi:hypothetical protein
MRVFKTKPFERFARKEGISAMSLCEAVARADDGLIDANLGGGLIKQRVARKGQGRSGGYRTIIVYRSGQTAIFIHGFAKSDKDNIDARELRELQKAATVFLALSDAELDKAVKGRRLIEVRCDDQEIPQ